METVLHIIFAYFGMLLIWFIICLLAYVASIVTKKAVIVNSLAGTAGTLYGFLQGMVYIYLFYIAITNGFLWFLFMIFIGLFLFSALFNLLQLPFVLIPAFFTVRVEKEIIDAELLTNVKKEQLDNERFINSIEDAEVILPTNQLIECKKYCSNCGERISKTSNFCTSCGTSLKG